VERTLKENQTRMKTEVLFEEANSKSDIIQKPKVLHVSWKGEQNVHSMKRGCEKIVEFMKARDCIKVVNDNVLANKPWEAVNECMAVHI
jgi:hypothetical protein